ncbi:SDR family oxidoreductase, partial [Candidatus Poribacteria bacterium]|nr:SDR family oxidoreductase [Candidatus Poribacteria bacterium]
MFEPIGDDEVTEFAQQRGAQRMAECVRYPELFDVSAMPGEHGTALIIGAAAKRLPDAVLASLGGAEPDETELADEYGFGIGRMAALLMGRCGWDVVGTYASSAGPARQLELALRGGLGRAESRMLPLDVTDVASVGEFANRLMDTHPRVRAIVYAPSAQVRKDRLDEVALDDMEYCMRGNYYALAELMRVVAPRALEGRAETGGPALKVVYIGSISGAGTPSPGRAAYCASKAAGMEYVTNLSAEYAPDIMAFSYNVSIADTAATVNVREKYAPIMRAESHYRAMVPSYEVARGLVSVLQGPAIY